MAKQDKPLPSGQGSWYNREQRYLKAYAETDLLEPGAARKLKRLWNELFGHGRSRRKILKSGNS